MYWQPRDMDYHDNAAIIDTREGLTLENCVASLWKGMYRTGVTTEIEESSELLDCGQD